MSCGNIFDKDRQHEELRKLLLDGSARAKQSEVAKLLGRTQGFVSRVETGSHRVTVIELIEFGQVLGFDPRAALARVMKKPANELPAVKK